MEEFSLTKLTKAIGTKCKECIFDSHCVGTWKQQVALCTAKNCPLYPVRPMQASLPLNIIEHYGMSLDELDTRARSMSKYV